MVGYRFFAWSCRHALHRLLVLSAGLCLCVSTQATTLRVALEDADNRPYSLRDASGAWAGFHIDLVRTVAERLGWDVKLIAVPWARAQNMLVQGTADAVIYIGRTPKRQSFAYFHPDNQLHVQLVRLYVRIRDADSIRYTPPLAEMMRIWRFGAPRGYFIGDEFETVVSAGAPLDQTAATPEKLFAMLMAGRIDVAVAEISAYPLVESRIREVRSHVVPLPGIDFAGSPMYIAFRRQGDGPRLAEEFARAYAAWRQSEAYPRLAARYGVEDRLPPGYRALRPAP